MKKINNTTDIICCKMRQHSSWYGKTGKSKCTSLATHTNGSHFFCRHHSKTGRYLIRNGDVGEILARFDTEQELRNNISKYPGMRMQKITKSTRRTTF